METNLKSLCARCWGELRHRDKLYTALRHGLSTAPAGCAYLNAKGSANACALAFLSVLFFFLLFVLFVFYLSSQAVT